jgi:hypothetical protein
MYLLRTAEKCAVSGWKSDRLKQSLVKTARGVRCQGNRRGLKEGNFRRNGQSKLVINRLQKLEKKEGRRARFCRLLLLSEKKKKLLHLLREERPAWKEAKAGLEQAKEEGLLGGLLLDRR